MGFTKSTVKCTDGSEDLLVVEEAGRAGREAVLEPVLHEVTDHLEVAWVEDPPGGVTVPEPNQDLSLKGRHRCESPRVYGRELTARRCKGLPPRQPFAVAGAFTDSTFPIIWQCVTSTPRRARITPQIPSEHQQCFLCLYIYYSFSFLLLITRHSDISDPNGVRQVLGYMPDNFGVYDNMKVWEFLDFFASPTECPDHVRPQKMIGEVLDLLDLTQKKDDYVNGLSKGMKQRLCLAKTLVHDPPVLILDEPASGLDPRGRLEMKLMSLIVRMGKTILVSSHILSELADFSASIGIIERGKLLAAGGVQEIQRRLRSHRVSISLPGRSSIRRLPGPS